MVMASIEVVIGHPSLRRRAVIVLGCLFLPVLSWCVSRALFPECPPVISIGPSRVKPDLVIGPSFCVLVLAPDGSLWSWGNGLFTDWMAPCRIGKDSDWAAIAVDRVHSVALKTNGTIWERAWADVPVAKSKLKQVSRETNWGAFSERCFCHQ